MGKARIAVVGSSNMDLVCKSQRIPIVGETILGGAFIMAPGGKGANQAVAAAKLGASVYFIAKLGKDVFGLASLSNFKKEKVVTKYVTQTDKAPSGVALIMVDEQGNNSIVVAPGANAKLSATDVKRAKSDIARCGAVVAQLEVPIETVEFAAKAAKRAQVPFILNPAPARALSDELLAMVDVLTPNETEAQILTGVDVKDDDSARTAAERLLIKGVKTVILTMGVRGYMFVDGNSAELVEAHKVEPVDTTAAGDAFTGALAFGIAGGKSAAEAARFANCVAALSVTKMGPQPSMPTFRELQAFIKNR
jgi:ribokinase